MRIDTADSLPNNSYKHKHKEQQKMRATPIIPGRLYRVTGAGIDMPVVASHPCAALCTALSLIGA